MRSILFLILFVTAGIAGIGESLAADDRPVGLVKAATDAYIVRDGKRLAATPGSLLKEGDLLETGAKGALGVILRDDTLLSLGSSSQTRIERFAYDPSEGRFAMVLKLSRGLMEYLSGKISKLSPGAVRIETPVATLGIRGTHLLARVEP